jgi:hypothetical protein
LREAGGFMQSKAMKNNDGFSKHGKNQREPEILLDFRAAR